MASTVNSYEAMNTDVIYLTRYNLKSNQTSEEHIALLEVQNAGARVCVEVETPAEGQVLCFN